MHSAHAILDLSQAVVDSLEARLKFLGLCLGTGCDHRTHSRHAANGTGCKQHIGRKCNRGGRCQMQNDQSQSAGGKAGKPKGARDAHQEGRVVPVLILDLEDKRIEFFTDVIAFIEQYPRLVGRNIRFKPAETILKILFWGVRLEILQTATYEVTLDSEAFGEHLAL